MLFYSWWRVFYKKKLCYPARHHEIIYTWPLFWHPQNLQGMSASSVSEWHPSMFPQDQDMMSVNDLNSTNSLMSIRCCQISRIPCQNWCILDQIPDFPWTSELDISTWHMDIELISPGHSQFFSFDLTKMRHSLMCQWCQVFAGMRCCFNTRWMAIVLHFFKNCSCKVGF